MTLDKGVVFFNPGYPVGANFKGYENFDRKIKGYENVREKIKGCEIFNNLLFKGCEILERLSIFKGREIFW